MNKRPKIESKEREQRVLQEMLSAARSVLEEARVYAEGHDLWFEFTGLRRGPGEDLKTLDVNDLEGIKEVERSIEEWESGWPRTRTDVLDLSEEWVGSWC